jgi:uncharacterized membrane protein YraQ (UPF0718 family)
LDGYTSLPLIHSLLELGAAMAFLVAGGITSLFALVVVWALVSRLVLI